MKLTINEIEYSIAFAYKPVVKQRLISKLVTLEGTEQNIEEVENIMLFLPEFLLIGLQKNHFDEFGFDYDTNNGKEEVLNKVFDLVDDYLNSEDSDFMELYGALSDEMMKNSFLSKMFLEEQKKTPTKKKTTTK